MPVRVGILILLLCALHVPPAAADPPYMPPGDPRYLEESAACREQASEDVTCMPIYGAFVNWPETHIATPFRLPAGAPDVFQHRNIPSFGPFYEWSSFSMIITAAKDLYPDARLWREVGLASDLLFATDVPVRAHWFFSVDEDELFSEDPGVDAGAATCLTVRTTVFTDRVFNSEKIVAQGETTKSVVSLGGGSGVPGVNDKMPCPGADDAPLVLGADVTEFDVDLGTMARAHVDRREPVRVHVEWFQHNGTGAPEHSGRGIELRTGAAYPNRLVLPMRDVIRIENLTVERFENGTFLHFAGRSAYGSVDVDVTNVSVVLRDPAGKEIPLSHLGAPIVRYDVSFRALFEPVDITLPWDPLAEALAPGTYTLEVSFPNHQHTAWARASIEYVVPPTTEEIPTTPTLTSVPLLVALVALVTRLAPLRPRL